MAGKSGRKEIIVLLEEAFGTYPGSELGKPLKEGACIQGHVDGAEYYLVKRGGELVVSEGTVPSPDITVELNRAACEYIAGARELPEFIERSRECIRGQRKGCVFNYRYNASFPRLMMKGYMDWARAFM
jgi:hypothetical protein